MSDQNTDAGIYEEYNTVTEDITITTYNAYTTPSEVWRVIKRMPPLKAPGSDKIQEKPLANLSKKAVVQLYYIYNTCIKQQFRNQEKTLQNLKI